MHATRPYGRRLSSTALGVLLALAACGPASEPAMRTDAVDAAAVAQAAASIKGILWPNLMLLDGEEPIPSLAEAERRPAGPSRFRIHVDVGLGTPERLDTLRALLSARPVDETAVQELLVAAAEADPEVNAAVPKLIEAVPYRGSGPGPRPRHELFMDRGIRDTLSYWYRMELDLKIPNANIATIASLLAGSDPAALAAELQSVVRPPLDPDVAALVAAIAIRH
ncbi:MAG TPA: hypothetical protein VLH75_16100 [Longimicrobiales bacterium]|nr:hypothetical protein [Longimicrobiales bacterium]